MSRIRFFLAFFFIIPLVATPQRQITLMLNPAGDAQEVGRIIDDNFERGLTLQFAQELKKDLELRMGNKVRIVLTRFPGETVEPLQQANFANRLHVDMYVSIHFFKESNAKPHVYIYHYADNPLLQTVHNNQLCLLNYTKAHIPNAKKTEELAKKLHANLKQYTAIDTQQVVAVPFKPLVGIAAPAIAIEAGIKETAGWSIYSTPLANTLEAIINAME